MMLGSKGLLTPLIPDCSALRALTILKNIRNPLIFLRKMASYLSSSPALPAFFTSQNSISAAAAVAKIPTDTCNPLLIIFRNSVHLSKAPGSVSPSGMSPSSGTAPSSSYNKFVSKKNRLQTYSFLGINGKDI